MGSKAYIWYKKLKYGLKLHKKGRTNSFFKKPVRPLQGIKKLNLILNYALSDHCISHFHKAGYICTFSIIDIAIFFLTIFHTGFMNL